MAALQDGFRQRVLRSTPHLVLTSKAFYHAHLKPLLGLWMSLYVEEKERREEACPLCTVCCVCAVCGAVCGVRCVLWCVLCGVYCAWCGRALTQVFPPLLPQVLNG